MSWVNYEQIQQIKNSVIQHVFVINFEHVFGPCPMTSLLSVSPSLNIALLIFFW